MTSTECGVLYAATGGQYVQEGKKSARSVKEAMPELPIAIVSDVDINSDLFDYEIGVDSPRHDFRDKIAAMSKTPFDRTLFLDTDTYVLSPTPELFELLDEFDIAAKVSPAGHQPPNRVHAREISNVSDAFSEPLAFPVYNTGVITYRDSPAVSSFLTDWYELFDSGDPIGHANFSDQESFRRVLYRSDLRIATLTPEYNFCYFERVQGRVKIWHSRERTEKRQQLLNAREGHVRTISEKWNNGFVVHSARDGSGFRQTIGDSGELISNTHRYLRATFVRFLSHLPFVDEGK